MTAHHAYPAVFERPVPNEPGKINHAEQPLPLILCGPPNNDMIRRAFFYAFGSAVLMGTIGVFAKITGLPAPIITFFRLLLGALFLLLFLAARGQLKVLRAWPSWPVLINGVLLAGFIIFYVQAMNYTSMAKAIMLVYLAPLNASVIAHFFLQERLNGWSTVLIFIAIFGFAMMMEFNLERSGSGREFIGLCYGLTAMWCYTGFILVNRRIKPEIDLFVRTYYQLLTGAVVMIPFMISGLTLVQPAHLGWLIGVGLFPGFLAILFAVIALSRLPAATFGTIAYIEPVAVVFFGWILFAETLSLLQISGCLLIIGAGIGKVLRAHAQQ